MSTMDDVISKHLPLAEKCCDYLTNSPDPFYAVKNSIQKLHSAGYEELSLREPFTDKLVKGGKYYYTLNKTTLVAFAIGGKHVAGNGFKIIGGHTDSPNLKVGCQIFPNGTSLSLNESSTTSRVLFCLSVQ